MEDQYKTITELIKNNIDEFEGYTLTEEGNVILITDKIADIEATPERQKEIFEKYKDCYKFIKAVEKLNPIYDNMILAKIKQDYLTKKLEYNYNIFLPLYDTYFIYEKLKTNDELLGRQKKTKLSSEKLKPVTDYTKKTGLIELAVKNFKLIDTVTQKQIIQLLLDTVDVANKEKDIEEWKKFLKITTFIMSNHVEE